MPNPLMSIWKQIPLCSLGAYSQERMGRVTTSESPPNHFARTEFVILWPGQPKKRVRIVSPVISLLSGMGEAAQGELRCHLGCSCLVSSVTIEGREWPSWALSFWLLFLLPFMVTEVIEERNSSKKLSSFPPPRSGLETPGEPLLLGLLSALEPADF